MNEFNTDLLNPMSSTPSQTVKPMNKFRHILENGLVVESVKPFPAEVAAVERTYRSAKVSCNMTRTDGKPIHFRNHYYTTKLLYDQQYLDNEIANGHAEISHATDDQAQQASMLIDPVGTIRKQIEDEIRAKVEAEYTVKYGLMNVSQNASSEEKIAGIETPSERAEKAIKAAGGVTVTVEKLGGIVSTQQGADAKAAVLSGK